MLIDALKNFNNPSLPTNLRLAKDVATFLLNPANAKTFNTVVSALLSYCSVLEVDNLIRPDEQNPGNKREKKELIARLSDLYSQKIESFTSQSAARFTLEQLIYTDWLKAFEWSRREAGVGIYSGIGFGSKN